MFMSINSNENWANGEATKQIRNRKEGTSEKTSERKTG